MTEPLFTFNTLPTAETPHVSVYHAASYVTIALLYPNEAIGVTMHDCEAIAECICQVMNGDITDG